MILKTNFLRLITICICSAGLALSCTNESTDFTRNLDFNLNWKYVIEDIRNAPDPALDISEWKNCDLPFDWSIVDFENQDSLHVGPFFKNEPMGWDIGFLRTGTAWYRKSWDTPKALGSKQVILNFDGVQTQMELWVNGQLAGEHVYGYTPFNINITRYLNKGGSKNTIAVKTVNTGENSRWFAGSGIYRSVRLSILNSISVADWGVFISTPEVAEEEARVEFSVRINNMSEASTTAKCKARIIAPDESVLEFDAVETALGSGESESIKFSGLVNNPELWGPDNPALYKAIVSIYANGKKTDSYITSFGIRSIKYSTEKGFLLNGKEILLKGGCLHHDNGILGAAAFPGAEFRRVSIMKENGYNAIRTSHNPPSEYFLNACDMLGVLVIDEAFDHWTEAKRPNDYSNYFNEWHVKDIQAMVYRDRNHPSVIMWSFGNEVPERADPEGIEIGKKLISAIHELDSTRPVTQAICGFWDRPGKDWDYSEGAFEILDIGGYNYQYDNYISDHEKYPQRMMYGSESFPLYAWENWEMVKRLPYVIGDFVWTGMDYIGEASIGHDYFKSNTDPDDKFERPWNWHNAWCGDIDLIGNKKPQSYYRDVIWGESKLEMAVLVPVPEGKHTEISRWGWHPELRSWNWEGYEGKSMHVKVYSSYPEVRLELNGTIIGTQSISSDDKYIAEFPVLYAPGELKAYGISDGNIMEEMILKTAEPEYQLIMEAEQDMINPFRNNIAFIKIKAEDANGTLVQDAGDNITVVVEGPAELLAAGNGAPTHEGSFTDNTFTLFRGEGLIVLRSSGEAGSISVKISSAQSEASVQIMAK